MEEHILTKNGILDAQVCSTGTYDEALDWIRKVNPAGTSNNWSKNTEGPFAPVRCAEHPDRTHYMFVC
jgi:hypothetical protein